MLPVSVFDLEAVSVFLEMVGVRDVDSVNDLERERVRIDSEIETDLETDLV